jgi:hypothetical protein
MACNEPEDMVGLSGMANVTRTAPTAGSIGLRPREDVGAQRRLAAPRSHPPQELLPGRNPIARPPLTSSDHDQQRLLFVHGHSPQDEDPIQDRPVTGNRACSEVGQQQHRSNSEGCGFEQSRGW